MKYVKQTVVISHYILADEAINKDVKNSIIEEVRGLMLGIGNSLVMRIGQPLSAQAARGEEPTQSMMVTVTEEEICNIDPETGDVQD